MQIIQTIWLERPFAISQKIDFVPVQSTNEYT